MSRAGSPVSSEEEEEEESSDENAEISDQEPDDLLTPPSRSRGRPRNQADGYGDSTSSKSVREAVWRSAAAHAETNYCGDMIVVKCTNHLGKNGGAHAAEKGHELHRKCAHYDHVCTVQYGVRRG